MKRRAIGYAGRNGKTYLEVHIMILRRIARPLLAANFVFSGIAALRNPKPRIEAAEPVLDKIPEQVHQKIPEQVPTDTETLVKVDAAVKVAAGIALGLNKFPRLAALVLAGTVVPTTAATHRFWEQEDPQERALQQSHFLKNMGLLGGLLLAAADTHGKPSLNWRARRAARTATGAVLTATGGAQKSVGAAASTVHKTAGKAQKQIAATSGKATGKAQKAAGRAAGAVRSKLPV